MKQYVIDLLEKLDTSSTKQHYAQSEYVGLSLDKIVAVMAPDITAAIVGMVKNREQHSNRPIIISFQKHIRLSVTDAIRELDQTKSEWTAILYRDLGALISNVFIGLSDNDVVVSMDLSYDNNVLVSQQRQYDIEKEKRHFDQTITNVGERTLSAEKTGIRILEKLDETATTLDKFESKLEQISKKLNSIEKRLGGNDNESK